MEVLTALDRDRIAELRERDEFFWLDLMSPSAEDLQRLGDMLRLHPVALEALADFDQRPRLDPYDGYVVLVFYGVGGQGRGPLDPIEVHMLISGSYIVTVHGEVCDQLEHLRDQFARGLAGGEAFVVYKVLDALADSFFPALAAVDEEIDQLEDAIIGHADEQQLQRIFQLKRNLVRLRQIATPQRDLLASTIEEITELPGFEADKRDYFRDVYDHMIRVSDLIDSYRDLLTGALDVYLSTVSNRLNAVMERLTIVATIFLPLTVLTGFFGMNFGWMVRHITSFGAFMALGVGGVVACVALFLMLFWRAGYLGRHASAAKL
jgi:magnesium transporter